MIIIITDCSQVLQITIKYQTALYWLRVVTELLSLPLSLSCTDRKKYFLIFRLEGIAVTAYVTII